MIWWRRVYVPLDKAIIFNIFCTLLSEYFKNEQDIKKKIHKKNYSNSFDYDHSKACFRG